VILGKGEEEESRRPFFHRNKQEQQQQQQQKKYFIIPRMDSGIINQVYFKGVNNIPAFSFYMGS